MANEGESIREDGKIIKRAYWLYPKHKEGDVTPLKAYHLMRERRAYIHGARDMAKEVLPIIKANIAISGVTETTEDIMTRIQKDIEETLHIHPR